MFYIFYVSPICSYVCAILLTPKDLLFVNRYSNCNNNSQNSHEDEEDQCEENEEQQRQQNSVVETVKEEREEDDGEEGAVASKSSTATTTATNNGNASAPKTCDPLEEAIVNNLLPKLIHPLAGGDSEGALDKLSCHDSGIDIRDPAILQHLLPQLQQHQAATQGPPKKYSDADIVLSTDWVPPVPLAHGHLTAQNSSGGSGGGSVLNADPGGRKKTSSVSFSVEESNDHHNNHDKTGGDNNKKNKVRISCAWTERFRESDTAQRHRYYVVSCMWRSEQCIELCEDSSPNKSSCHVVSH